MNRHVYVYTELDTLFDARRATLSDMMTADMVGGSEDIRKQKGDTLWDLHFAKNYRERRLDLFEFPALGIDREGFVKQFKERASRNWTFMYPTNFRDKLLSLVIEQEQLVDRPIALSAVELYINTYPYVLDQDTQEDLRAYCQTAFKGFVKVKLIHQPTEQLTAMFYKQFAYVFKYDLLLGEEYEPFWKSIKTAPIPDTCVVVPDVLVEESEELCGPIDERIQAMGYLIAVCLKLLPVSHAVYDYADE